MKAWRLATLQAWSGESAQTKCNCASCARGRDGRGAAADGENSAQNCPHFGAADAPSLIVDTRRVSSAHQPASCLCPYPKTRGALFNTAPPPPLLQPRLLETERGGGSLFFSNSVRSAPPARGQFLCRKYTGISTAVLTGCDLRVLFALREGGQCAPPSLHAITPSPRLRQSPARGPQFVTALWEAVGLTDGPVLTR